jgi:Zn finger protein HypA/HybF involved in hydrogenase expression
MGGVETHQPKEVRCRHCGEAVPPAHLINKVCSTCHEYNVVEVEYYD